jgi:multiple sugar transport system permease protein
MKKSNQFFATRPHEVVILLVIAALFIVPFLWMVFASLDAAARLDIRWPSSPTFGNYARIIGNPANQTAFANGLVMSFSVAALVVVAALLCAYPLSRYKFGFEGPFLYGLLFLTGLPISAIMIPTYMIFFSLGWLDSLFFTTLFLVATSLPYNIWMMKSFLDGISGELEEAAAIDGASVFQVLTRVIVPLILPGLFVVFIFAFLGVWSNFLVPFILLNSSGNLPPAVTIYQFFSSYGRVSFGDLAAYSALYTTPVLVLYVVAQRFMTRGYALSGAVK